MDDVGDSIKNNIQDIVDAGLDTTFTDKRLKELDIKHPIKCNNQLCIEHTDTLNSTNCNNIWDNKNIIYCTLRRQYDKMIKYRSKDKILIEELSQRLKGASKV